MKVTATGSIARAALEELLYMDDEFEGELIQSPNSSIFYGSRKVPKFKHKDQPYHKPKPHRRIKSNLKDF